MDYAQRRKQQSKQTEQAILEAALALMREKGFEAVTVRDVCHRAGITTGAFYHHFRSKEDLFSKGFTPLDQYMERSLAGQEEQPPAVRLRLILQTYARFMESSGELTARYYQRRLADTESESLDPSRYIHRAMLGCLTEAREQGILAPNVTPEWMADFCFRLFRGTVVDWILHRREYDLTAKMLEDYDLLVSLFQISEKGGGPDQAI